MFGFKLSANFLVLLMYKHFGKLFVSLLLCAINLNPNQNVINNKHEIIYLFWTLKCRNITQFDLSNWTIALIFNSRKNGFSFATFNFHLVAQLFLLSTMFIKADICQRRGKSWLSEKSKKESDKDWITRY